LTLLPRNIWEPYQPQIRWLEAIDGMFTKTKVGGKSVAFRLGLVVIHFLDFDQREIVRSVLAGCVEKNQALKAPILGLGFGQALTTGGLCLNFVEDSLWLASL
jgi:hypothetical protein